MQNRESAFIGRFGKQTDAVHTAVFMHSLSSDSSKAHSIPKVLHSNNKMLPGHIRHGHYMLYSFAAMTSVLQSVH